MTILKHLHPAIIHFPIVIFLLTATAQVFSQTIPAELIRLGLLWSLLFGALAIGTGYLAAYPIVAATPAVLRWHIAAAAAWFILAAYLYKTFDSRGNETVTLAVWVLASLIMVALGTLGGWMVYS